MGSDHEEKEDAGLEGDRVIDSYIQKAVDEGEISVEEIGSSVRYTFWDKNTIRAAIIGVAILLTANLFFYYSMRVDESDNTTQWELSKRDFLVEYREKRLAQAGVEREPISNEVEFVAESEELAEDLIEVAIEDEIAEAREELEPVIQQEEVQQVMEAEVPTDQIAQAVEEVSVSEDALLASLSETEAIVDTSITEESEEELVVSTVRNWAQAWSFQDVDGYLAHYSQDFVSQGGAPIGPWSELRADRVAKPEWIHVVIEEVNALVDGDLAVVEFLQVYSASNYSDESIKTLILQDEGGVWRIIQETSQPSS